jgi:hypothetical protein
MTCLQPLPGHSGVKAWTDDHANLLGTFNGW